MVLECMQVTGGLRQWDPRLKELKIHKFLPGNCRRWMRVNPTEA